MLALVFLSIRLSPDGTLKDFFSFWILFFIVLWLFLAVFSGITLHQYGRLCVQLGSQGLVLLGIVWQMYLIHRKRTVMK